MRIVGTLAGLILCSVFLFADEHNVDFDHHTDFSKLKTFAVRQGKVNSPRPELNNPLLLKKVADTIQTTLTARGLKGTANSPDILVDYSVTSEDFSETRGGAPAFSQGTLVIDLIKRDSNMLVWRSVYRDNEKNSAKLAQKLPDDAKKSLSEYPPKQSGVIEPVATPILKQALSPKEAAAAALEIISSTRKDTAFVGGDNHPGLVVSFNKLERIARVLVEDDGKSPAAFEGRTKGFVEAVHETADLADSIATRNSESSVARTKSRELATKLLALIN
jgi:hypothetical protein